MPAYGTTIPKRLFGDLTAVESFVRGCEELGLTYVRLPDRVTSGRGDPTHEPLVLCAYLAALARKITFVSAVLVAPSRQTVLLAKQVAELHHLSNGRLRLGVGIGGNRREYVASGFEYRERGVRLESQIEALRALWRGEAVFGDQQEKPRAMTVDRPAVTIEPIPASMPPIWFGTSDDPPDGAIRRVARLADGWFVPRFDAAQPIHDKLARFAEREGRNLRGFGVEGEVSLDADANVTRQADSWGELGFVTHICLSTWSFDSLSADAHLERIRVNFDALR